MYYSYRKILILALLQNGFIYYYMQSRLVSKRTRVTCSNKTHELDLTGMYHFPAAWAGPE